MTVSYQYDVASSSTGGFFRLLWRWRGSIWKLLYKELLLFCGVYLCIAFTYDFLMSDYYKRYYERTVIFCSAFVEIIPLSFILGFYVSFTAHRWWQQYTAIPWPDKLMNIIALYVPGNDVTSRVLRRTLMRYLNLTLVLVLRSISIPVKRRFPTKEHLVEAGFMSRPELEMYSSVPSHEFNTFWIPCTWFVNLLREAKSECRITDSGGIKLIMEEFNEFRSKCGLLWSYDWVSIPLVYTQVVTLSTQAFFLASLLGRQHINPPKSAGIKPHDYGEYYIPVFTLLQFILYMGLLKLGEQLINPFGDDDEDFELNWIIDRHLKVSFLGVDILNSDPPPLIKDNYFDEMDIKLPYTEAAVAHKVKTYRGSVAAFHVPTSKHGLVIPEFDDDDENGECDEASSTIQSNREANTHTSSWSLFKGKRKLSSSIDSFNSETMVERGLEETEMPTLKANSSWHNFLASEGNTGGTTSSTTSTGKTSAPASATAPAAAAAPAGSVAEDTQGIRGFDQTGGHRQYDQYGQLQPEDVPLPPSVKDRWKHAGRMEPPHGSGAGNGGGSSKSAALKASPLGEIKQSSFESTDSSNQSHVVIPMEEDSREPQQRSAGSTPGRFFHFRKSPLQVFASKDKDKERDSVSLVGNAPVSAFRTLGAEAAALLQAQQQHHRNSGGDRSSLSSVSLKSEVPVTTKSSSSSKPPKSLMKCHRTVDPKLRIRPFRSKVTFSEDTKAGDNTSPEKRGGLPVDSGKYSGSVFSKWDSSSDSVSSGLLRPSAEEQQQQEQQPISLKRHHTFSESSGNVRTSTLKVSDIPFADLSKRRQSFDPTLASKLSCSASKPLLVEADLLNKDNWLHYQSLPNIQEEEQCSQQTSPTERSPPREAFSVTLTTTTSSAVSGVTATEPLPVRVTPPTPSPPPFNRPSSTAANVLLSPPLPATPPLTPAPTSSTTDSPTWKDGGRRRSLKRQKSQDVPDEKPPLPLKSPPALSSTCPPLSMSARIAYLNKQSSDESQTSNLTENSSNSSTNQLKQGTTTAAGGGGGIFSRARKEDLKPRQASTESDTASYHTVNSYMLMEKSNSSSIDSFTSANSEANNNSSSNGHSQAPKEDGATEHRPSTVDVVSSPSPSTTPGPVNGSSSRAYPHLMHHESSLVPTITFSQSTPSVTSQSSDDQNSPKWDDQVAGVYQDRFASMEQVLEATAKQNAQRAAAAAAAAAAGRQQQTPAPPLPPSSSSCESFHLTIQGPDDDKSSSAQSSSTTTSTATTQPSTTTPSTAIRRVNTAGNGNDRRS